MSLKEYQQLWNNIQLRRELAKWVAVLVLVPLLINLINTGKLSPYSVEAPQFLFFYTIVLIVAFIAFYQLQKRKWQYMRQTADAWFPAEVSVFQLAHFLYGKQRAIQTCLVDLYRRRLVTVNDNGKIVVHRSSYQSPDKEKNPLIPAMLKTEDGGYLQYDTIDNDWYTREAFDHEGLERLFSITGQRRSFFTNYLVIAIAALIGIVRIIQGTKYNNIPVDFIVMELLALIAAIMISQYKFSSKSILFNKVEERMMEKADEKSLHADEVVVDYALNGQTISDWLPKEYRLNAVFATFPVISDEEKFSDDWVGDYDIRWRS
jgi:uncharacterized protein (TIGR04222 family)